MTNAYKKIAKTLTWINTKMKNKANLEYIYKINQIEIKSIITLLYKGDLNK